MRKLIKGDEVIVITGKDKGKTGVIDKVISDKPNCLIIKNKNNDEIGYLSTKRLSEILKR